MQWFINTGETLLKIPVPPPRAHALQYSSLSLLSHLSPITAKGSGDAVL